MTDYDSRCDARMRAKLSPMEYEKEETMRPKQVAIIGSSKFKLQQLGVAQRETLRGKIVLLPGFWHHVDMVPISDEQKAMIDDLTLKKIEQADEVIVVNVNTYVGQSTRRGIEHAKKLDKPITYLEPPRE